MYMRNNNRGDAANGKTVIKDSSFLLKIKYSQNHTIQGSIQWLEKRKTVCFRSMMELILLLQEASNLTECRTWDSEDGVISEVQELKQISEF